MLLFLRYSSLVVLFFVFVCSVSCTPPIRYTPSEMIPSSLPNDIKQNINDLYSIDPSVRANAAQYLGSLGPEAFPAVPYLIDILTDNRNVWQDLICGEKGVWRPFAIDCVDSSAHYSKLVKSTVGAVVGNALQRITEQDFKDDPIQWRAWWRQNHSDYSEQVKEEPVSNDDTDIPTSFSGF